MFRQIQNRVSDDPHYLFLLDGIGAILSAFLYGVVLANFEDVFGMPKVELYYLCGLACLYAIFSMSSFVMNVECWRRNLKIIASANFIHTIITFVLLLYYSSQITTMGLLYFGGEITIVFAIAYYEFLVSTKPFPNSD